MESVEKLLLSPNGFPESSSQCIKEEGESLLPSSKTGSIEADAVVLLIKHFEMITFASGSDRVRLSSSSC